METSDTLKRIIACLCDRNLGQAMDELECYVSARPRLADNNQLLAIKSDFKMMLDYWQRGYRDPQLPALYQTLLQRLYVLWANIAKGSAVASSSYLASVNSHVQIALRDWSPQVVREEMEAFVSETALLELEPQHIREVHRQELFRRHQYQMNLLFDHVWTSGIWTDGQAAAMEEILLSPTIDANDQQLLVSAVMLAAIEFFDMAKFRTLVNVYRHAVDERVRQRALVGWVLSRRSAYAAFYPEEVQLVESLLEDGQCCRELVELQKQIFFCVNAEKDNRTIQQEIMPDLLKNQNFRFTRNGLEEVEEDPMEDILHPDEQERKLEHVEENIQRMIAMQKQGSDIYFGGFSQMKRFPFFSEICNWFVPFYLDHPAISGVMARLGDNNFLRLILEKMPFCNSDKYSFVFGFQQVIDKLPKNMREMLERGEASLNEIGKEELESPAFIRRIYLQDLYRFFKIFPYRSVFSNPFDEATLSCLFCADSIFSRTHLEAHFNEVVLFLLKQNRMEEAQAVLRNYGEARRDLQFWLMAGHVAHYSRYDGKADAVALDEEACYRRALALQPDSERALQGLARALFDRGHFAEAKAYFEKLLDINPEKKSYRRNYAACLTNYGQYGEALKVLYRLNYENPDDQSVNRVLAWALTCDEKYDRAEKIYNQLLSVEHPAPVDLLNHGYCLWLSGSVNEATDCFVRFLKETGESPDYIIENERELLAANGITEAEMRLMLYAL